MDMEKYMREALALASEAAAAGEIPVGCVVVDREGNIIGRGRNRREERRSVVGHAEIEALEAAAALRGDWRMDDCSLYVTLEPCPMCAGAIINSRIPRVVVGAKDEKCGACGSVCDLFAMEFNHHPQVEFGLLEEESQQLMSSFFQDLRVKLKDRPKWKKPE